MLVLLMLKLMGISLNKEISKKMKIEIFGDSITNGYALEASSDDTPFSTKYENYSLSYAYLTEKQLNINVNAISVSGFPLYKSIYTDNSIIKTIPEIFTLSSFSSNKTIDNLQNGISLIYPLL